VYATLIGRHWAAPYNHDYPLAIPFKKTVGPLMKSIGSRVTKRLTPPPPREITRRSAPKRASR